MKTRAIRRKKHASTPRISRARLRTMRDELNAAHDAVTDTVHNFWIIPDGDIRETLAATQKKVARAVAILRRAA